MKYFNEFIIHSVGKRGVRIEQFRTKTVKNEKNIGEELLDELKRMSRDGYAILAVTRSVDYKKMIK